MSLASQVQSLATRIGTEFKAIRAITGSLSNLTTLDKSNLVNALNELKTAQANASGISDGTTSTSATWSSDRITTAISAANAALVAGAPSQLDALNELAAAINNDANFAATTATSLGNRLRVDVANQGLSALQKANGQANLDVPSNSAVGDPTTDFVGTFVAALV